MSVALTPPTLQNPRGLVSYGIIQVVQITVQLHCVTNRIYVINHWCQMSTCRTQFDIYQRAALLTVEVKPQSGCNLNVAANNTSLTTAVDIICELGLFVSVIALCKCAVDWVAFSFRTCKVFSFHSCKLSTKVKKLVQRKF